MERARRWVGEHSKSVSYDEETDIVVIEAAQMVMHKFSQAEIRDEIDYLITMMTQTEPDAKTKEFIWTLVTSTFPDWNKNTTETVTVITPEVKVESKPPSETFDYLELARRVANEVINKK
jgi:hypothetical protein